MTLFPLHAAPPWQGASCQYEVLELQQNHCMTAQLGYGEGDRDRRAGLLEGKRLGGFGEGNGLDGFAGLDGDVEVVEGDNVFDDVEILAAAFGDIMQQMEDVAIFLGLMIEGGKEGRGAVGLH